MIFNTWTFALFAVVTLSVYWMLIPHKYKRQYIVFSGCIFYAFSVPAYLLLILALGVLTYAAGSAMVYTQVGRSHKKQLMTAAVIAIVAVLGFFKYARFFAATVAEVGGHNILPLPHFTVPLAISFFTFEFVHVLVDVYYGKIERLDPWDFAAFTMFFPTLVAGPIKRFQNFAPQVRNVEMPPTHELALDLYRVAIGLAKKFVIADSMTALTQPITSPDGAPFGRLDYLVALLAYTAKIYFDFSGYSDIAIGVAGLLGIRIPENFARPYRSQNISIFWRRWHMSLSSWIRDYIFIPLGGSRRPPLATALNLFTAMAIAGLWHGAAWTFVAWGIWHGAGLGLHRLWSARIVPAVPWLETNRFIPPLSVGLTFAFVVLGWVLFAAGSFSDARVVLERAFAF